MADASPPPGRGPARAPQCAGHTVTAHVVALEQVYIYNRYGAYNPQGLIYALRRDVVSDGSTSDVAIDPVPNATRDAALAGHVRLRSDKRPRPLVLRVAEGDCLEVTFTNLIGPRAGGETLRIDPANGRTVPIDRNQQRTRMASIHVNGLDLASDIRSTGDNVGLNPSGLVAPGETQVYRWLARAEGGYLFYSSGAPVGGEGNGGQLALGLFGAINVEPKGSVWYRSQVSGDQFAETRKGVSALNTPIVDYAAKDAAGPVLAILDGQEIVHGDLNAIIAQRPGPGGEPCQRETPGPQASCGQSFREFTAIFHDELTADQAFPELEDPTDPLRSVRDGMGINYGASGLGSTVLANRDPAKRYALDDARLCVECKLEEFFLSAWVAGDPAMIMERDGGQRAIKALYPDDPANVHHSYMSDPVRFRNIHAGPKETHIFHLHAHQWLRDPQRDDSVYLDSQTISPGASFTYEIEYGGSGNRNLLVGDSIFHCHLYPHFAQGMWAMWRAHDVFEDGSAARRLPDAELADGTPNPAVVPIPGRALAPSPTATFKGYPFYIAGRIGHRPPQAPKDLDREGESGTIEDGGLPRHVVAGGTRLTGEAAIEPKYFDSQSTDFAVKTARRVRAANGDARLFTLATKVETAKVETLPWDGTPDERRAMAFHSGDDPGAIVSPTHNVADATQIWWPNAKGYRSCDAAGICYDAATHPDLLFRVNGQKSQPGAPYADPCPTGTRSRAYAAAYVQFDMPVNKYGWHDPQARIIVLEDDIARTLSGDRKPEPFFFRANSGECVLFKGTNLMPSVLNLDDFEVYSPTDTIGQHIHLVKFDVTASDGSANGWNYEDATFSPDEVVERIVANNAWQREHGGSDFLRPKTHRLFRPGGALAGDARGVCPEAEKDWHTRPWCGAQTTVQRWWADPLLDNEHKDRTIRTVFTHDHLGPSSHQQHGLYAALVVEPKGSTWETLGGTLFGGEDAAGNPVVSRRDGGPTFYAANILVPETSGPIGHREFNIAIADYVPLYTGKGVPVNAPNTIDHDLPTLGLHGRTPRPEAISTTDPGGQLVNYRSEPLAERIGAWSSDGQLHQRPPGDRAPDCVARMPERLKLVGLQSLSPDRKQPYIDAWCARGDMANAFSSVTHGDPSTPLLEAYVGDPVQIRLIQGSQEENHIVAMHGVKWLAQPGSPDSGYTTAQQLGISEHFEFNINLDQSAPQAKTDYFYRSTATDDLWNGAWGLLRAYGFRARPTDTVAGLKRLPNNPALPESANIVVDPAGAICPGPPTRRITIVAALASTLYPSAPDRVASGIVYSPDAAIYDPNAILLYLARDSSTDQRGVFDPAHPPARPQPLMIRMNAGECLAVEVDNQLPPSLADGIAHPASWSHNRVPGLIDHINFNDVAMSSRIGLHVPGVAVNLFQDDGANVGFNRDSTVAAGKRGKTMYWYAGDFRFDPKDYAAGPTHTPIEFGVLPIEPTGDVIKHSAHGAIGALIVEPAGARFDPDCTAAGCRQDSGTVTTADGKSFREFVVVYQDDVAAFRGGEPIPNLIDEDDANDTGQRSWNYGSDPLWARVGADPATDAGDLPAWDWSAVFSSYRCADNSGRNPCADGSIPAIRDPQLVFTAQAGAPIRFRVVQPSGHPRNHAFSVTGHNWPAEPWNSDSTVQQPRSEPAFRFGSQNGLGPARHVNLLIDHAGGEGKVPGDYLIHAQEGLSMLAGLWGILRVTPAPEASPPAAAGER